MAVLLLLSGPALPPRSPLAFLARIPVGANASVLVSGGDAIVVDVHGGRDRISVYSLGDDRMIWSRPLALVAAGVTVRLTGGVAVATTGDNAIRVAGTEAFDLASGEPLWHSPNTVTATSTTGDLLMDAAQPTGDSVLQLVTPRTGKVGWRLAVGAGCATAFGQDPAGLADQLVEMCFRPDTPAVRSIDAPTLRVIDLTSGTSTASRDLTYDTAAADFYLLPNERLPAPELTIVGDLALVTHNAVPTPTVDAFASATLAPEWTGMPITSIDSLQPCGGEICMYAGADVSVIDRATGKPARGATAPVTLSRARLLLVPVNSVLTNAVPVNAVDPDETAYPIPAVRGGLDVSVPPAAHGDAWLVEQRPITAAPAPGPTSTPASGSLIRIAPIHEVGPRSCFTAADYLACTTAADRLTFWRLPPL